jgi:hypothetical protein
MEPEPINKVSVNITGHTWTTIPCGFCGEEGSPVRVASIGIEQEHGHVYVGVFAHEACLTHFAHAINPSDLSIRSQPIPMDDYSLPVYVGEGI